MFFKYVLRLLIWPASFGWFGVSLISVFVYLRDLDASFSALISLLGALTGLLSLLVMNVTALRYPNISVYHVLLSQIGCGILGYVMYVGIFSEPLLVLSGFNLLVAACILTFAHLFDMNK
ncbi:hypothetical protein [Pseudoalteromonas byunsanensis]|uniref:Uncharacterized protein n=1 Tax=Pseudoalteromonas byunsanensis TaxID=327939 RepID=A0A1S1NBE7_9GAMM|nr:hypothetical protein [Pseudoalteromonas byunsanensis]OHU96744.1 hypothetical protein BIW53_05315 [Pseudoalteromonas byunsanensis]